MKHRIPFVFRAFALCITLLAVGNALAAASDAAKEILKLSGIQGGIVVHLGCGDGSLTAALRVDDRYTVHGLDADANNVRQARKRLASMKLQGPVSIEQHTGPTLPYTDNLINLVVVENPADFPMSEVMRVLAPQGVACVRRNNQWHKQVKPRPQDIDQWTHHLHDSTNNAVARDSLVGPPRSVQWLAPPSWLRSHETPSGIQSPVASGRRLYYIFDRGLIGITDERLPDRWSLVCRDAFNGKRLWQRPMGSWGWRAWNRKHYEGKDWTVLSGTRTNVPPENQRRLVADGDRLYATLSYRAPMSILDATTGKTITTIDATRGTREILAKDGVALAYAEPHDAQAAQRRGAEKSVRAALVAVDGASGKIRWRQSCGTILPLSLAIDQDRVLYLSGGKLHGHDWKDGRKLWQVPAVVKRPKAFVAIDGVVVMHNNRLVAAHDASDGRLLWKKKVAPLAGAESEDLFVIDGLVWRGMECVNDELKHVKHSPNVLLVGWDLCTGEEKRRIVVKNFRSPEHHHRCYRNKATDRYVISSFEGAEFVDLKDDHHRASNWLRGSCKSGMMPCNGMLYVPSDQCFCQPGAKLLGYAAVTAADSRDLKPLPDGRRLEKGPAYNAVAASEKLTDADWPTFRHDAARHGTTTNPMPANVSVAWKTDLQGPLTAPVAVGDKVFVAESDAHRVNALDMATGKLLWQFTAAARIDSPPTIHNGMVLFGSNDGRVYCLRAADGQLAWKFLAAPLDRRIACFEQLESAWPVHGSVLLHDGVAYCTAGRSTYLDGGIRLYGLDPASGKVLHSTTLEGPHRTVDGERDVAFFIPGANSDVLVSEGGFIYMRQKKFTPQLKEIDVKVLSSKGAQDVGLHVFSTAGLLDASWYNRTYWMYSKRWPGFQLANQAPKTGQLLVVDDKNTYAVRVFHRRNRHSTMFFPGKEGYLLFADKNTTEPQIVGEPGSRQPVRWLPQSEYLRGRPLQPRALDSEAFGLDKMVGYTRAEAPLWKQWHPVRIRAMVKAGETLFVAGPPDELDPKDPYAAFENRKPARLLAISPADGATLAETNLKSPPVFDAIIAAHGRLFVSLEDGSVVCLAAR